MGVVANKDRRQYLQENQQVIGPVDQKHTFYLKSDKEMYPYIINHNNREDLKKYKFRIKSSQTTMEEMSNFGEYLSIRQVHIPAEYIKELGAFKNYLKGNQEQQQIYHSQSQKNQNIYNHQYFDIALVELENPLEVSNGFQICEKAKPWKEIILRNVQIAGYPYSQAKFGSKYGYLYFQKVEFHEKAPADCIKLVESEGQGSKMAIIKHEISTLAGNSGSPIFERVGESCYLFGIHTAGVFRGQSAIYNFGTYIYAERIYSWLNHILSVALIPSLRT